MTTRTCRATRRVLEAYHDGELPVEEQVAIQSHLRHCESCAAERRWLREAGSILRDAALAHAASDPEAVGRNLFARIPVERQRAFGRRVRASFDDMRLVEENTTQFRCRPEDCLKQMPQATADVTNRAKYGEIVGVNDWWNCALRLRLHTRIENLRLLRMLFEISKDFAHCGLAGAHYLLKSAPTLPEHWKAHKPYIGAH